MSDEEQLQEFASKWDAAMIRNDVEEISQFMADDWVIVGTEGGITTKSEFLETIASGDLTHDRMDSDEMRVTVYEKSGLVISRGTSAGHYKGQRFILYEWSMNMIILKGSRWQCVSTMLTKATAKSSMQ